jgi:hypothetical protein
MKSGTKVMKEGELSIWTRCGLGSRWAGGNDCRG